VGYSPGEYVVNFNFADNVVVLSSTTIDADKTLHLLHIPLNGIKVTDILASLIGIRSMGTKWKGRAVFPITIPPRCRFKGGREGSEMGRRREKGSSTSMAT